MHLTGAPLCSTESLYCMSNGTILQDNVFVQMLCSIQYRVVRQNADDAFYELQNPREQIQAYVFDGNLLKTLFGFCLLHVQESLHISICYDCSFLPSWVS